MYKIGRKTNTAHILSQWYESTWPFMFLNFYAVTQFTTPCELTFKR
jgi:hypothetical protein